MELGKVRDARNLGVGEAGRENTENYRPRNQVQVVGKPEIMKIATISIGVSKTGCVTGDSGGSNYTYDPYRDFHATAWPKINTTPIE